MFQYVYKATVLHLFSDCNKPHASHFLQPCIYERPIYPQKSPMYPQKSPVYPQKSPIYPQKSPVYPQKQPRSCETRFVSSATPHASHFILEYVEHTRLVAYSKTFNTFHFILCYVQYVWFPLLMRRACSSYFKFEYVHDISFYMLWGLRSVGLIKLYVSFAKYRLLYRAFLQKRPII